MIHRFLPALAVGALVHLTAPALSAQEREDSARIAELERRLDVLTRELERIALGEEVVQADEPAYGLPPAAAKVYRVRQGVSIGGYGEILYENFAREREDGIPSGKVDQLDQLRAIVYLGYKFNDRLLFNSETEFEHGSTGAGGSVSVEFAYVDYRLTETFGARAGLLLVPMGLVNELHEPLMFLPTERSLTETRLLPSTWRESGIGVYGENEAWSYRVYLINSFDGVGGGSSKAKGFGDSGLRGGRQKGSKALAENFAAVARLDYVGTPGLTVGGSVYRGGGGQGRDAGGSTLTLMTTIWEAHLRFVRSGWDVQALYAGASLDEVEKLNELKGITGDASPGTSLSGWYAQVGYDLLWNSRSEHQLLPYVRYEAVNTQKEVPAGYAVDPSNDLDVLALGVAWKPIANVVLKADYQIHGNAASTGVNQFNVALGYLF